MDRHCVTGSGALVASAKRTEIHLEGIFNVAFESDTETLVVRWEEAISSEELKAGYTTLLKIVSELKPRKWLIDLHMREQIRSIDRLWIVRNVFSKALQMVNRDIFIAEILPVYYYHTLVNELDGDELISNGNLIIINQFLYEEEGRRWLEHATALK